MKSLTSLILIVIAVAVGYIYTWPQWQKIQVLNERQAELTDALERAQQIDLIKQDLEMKYNTIAPEDTKKINRVVPEKFEPIKLIADINDLAARYNLVIRETKFAEESSDSSSGVVEDIAPVAPYKIVTLSFNTSGQYRSLYSFISDLEKSLQLMDIKKVSVAPSQESESSRGGLDITITLDTYWMN